MGSKKKKKDQELEFDSDLAVDEEFLNALTDTSTWIAGNPPWFAEAFISKCPAKSREEAIRLLRVRTAIEKQDTESFKPYLAEGIDPNALLGKRDGTLLEFALERYAVDIIHLLLDAGADARRPGLVARACEPGMTPVLERLLHAGAVPDVDGDGNGVLAWVCMGMHGETAKQAKLLLEKGETPSLDGFKSKAGKEFSAKLKVKGDKVQFDFS